VYNSDNIHHYMVDKYTYNKHTKGTLSKQRIIILISAVRQVRPTRLFAQLDTTSYR